MQKGTQNLVWVVFVLAVVYMFPWKNITWGKLITSTERTVTMSGYAESQEKNQIARFSAGVDASGTDKAAVVSGVNEKMTKLVKQIKDFGVADEDIQTQNVNTYQAPESDQSSDPAMQEKIMMPPVRKGGLWHASNSVEVVLRDVNKAGTLTDLLNASGATNVWGPSFTLDTKNFDNSALMAKAVSDSKTKAEAIARASGSKLGRAISIVESGSTGYYPMMAKGGVMMETSAVVPAPVEIGSTTLSKSVTVVWSLE